MEIQEGPLDGFAFNFLAYRKVVINGVVVWSKNGSDRATVLSQILVGDKPQRTLNSSPGIEGFVESIGAFLRRSGVFFKIDTSGKAPSRIRMYVLIPIGLLAEDTLLASVDKVSKVRIRVLELFRGFMEPAAPGPLTAEFSSSRKKGGERVSR